MNKGAKLLGHPIHPMLVVFPLGLLSASVIFDIIGFIVRYSDWHLIAFYMVGAGVIGGLIAAIFGLVDWLAIPGGTRAKTIGLFHGLVNVIVTILFMVSGFLRGPLPKEPNNTAFIVALVGLGLAFVGGWLGGELVYRLGVGVELHTVAENTHAETAHTANILGESS